MSIIAKPSGATTSSYITVRPNSSSSTKIIKFSRSVSGSKPGQTAVCSGSATQAAKSVCTVPRGGGLFGCTVGEKKLVLKNQADCPDQPYQSFTLAEQTCMPGNLVNTWVDTNAKNVLCNELAYVPPVGVVVQTLQPAGDPLATAWINGFDGEVPGWLKTLLGPSMVCPHDTLPPPFILLKDRFCPWGRKLAESCTNLVRRGMAGSQRGVVTCGECESMLDRCSDFDFQPKESIRQACRGLR